jgi:hypothetical protein
MRQSASIPPTASPLPTLSVRPVLNRMIDLLSISLDEWTPKLPPHKLTPVISLWNPYDNAHET